MMGIEIDCHEKGFEHPILTERLFSLVFFSGSKVIFQRPEYKQQRQYC